MTKPKLRFKDKNGNAYPEWEERKIGDICKTFSGGTPSITNTSYYNGDIPFIKSGEIHSCETEMTITEAGLKNSSAKLVSKGDLLFALYGATSGDVDISKIDGAINQAILCIRSENMNLLFLKNLFSLYKEQILCKYLQGGQGNLSAEIIKSLMFFLPCLNEQEKIAGFLSKVDELINECEGEVKDLEEQKKGLMQKIFSQQIRFKDSNNNPYPDWEEHCINEFIISLKSGLSRELQNEDIGIPVIRANNTYNGIVGGNNIDNYVLDDGDILINFINSLPRMGEAAIFTNFLNRPCIYTTNLLRLKLNNKLNYKYFFYYTKTSEYINYIKAITKPAVNQASFTTVDFKNMKLLLPCQEEQEKIAKVLSKMDELIEEKKALLSDWQQFKKGLLQQMFV